MSRDPLPDTDTRRLGINVEWAHSRARFLDIHPVWGSPARTVLEHHDWTWEPMSAEPDYFIPKQRIHGTREAFVEFKRDGMTIRRMAIQIIQLCYPGIGVSEMMTKLHTMGYPASYSTVKRDFSALVMWPNFDLE